MTQYATYKTTDGTPDRIMGIESANRLLLELGDRVAPPFDNDEQNADIYEIYGEGETADDYPDGDPYADCLVIPRNKGEKP